METHPCKCSFFGDPIRECRCSPVDVKLHRDRISMRERRGA